LGPDASRCRKQIGSLDLGDQTLQASDEGFFAEGTPEFIQSLLPMSGSHAKETRIGQAFEQVSQVDFGFGVAFTGESENCIWSAFDATLNHPREVDPEKRKSGVGDRIDQTAAEVFRLWLQLIVFPAEGDDEALGSVARGFGHSVAVQSGAIDQQSRSPFPARGVNSGMSTIGRGGGYATACDDGLAAVLDEPGQSFADFSIVDDPGIRNVNRLNPSRMRFQFPQSLAVDPFAPDLIRLAALVDALQGWEFLFGHSDNHLAAELKRDAFLSAESLHGDFSLSAVDGLQGPRAVVDPRVENAGVVPRLMISDVGFLFEEGDSQVRSALSQLPCSCQANNPTPDNHDIGSLHACAQGS
jgi:hypothetical protein